MIAHDSDLRRNLFVIVSPEKFEMVVSGNPVTIDDENYHHIRRVLRYKGDVPINICAGDGSVLPAKLNHQDSIEKTSENPIVFTRQKKVSLITSGIQKKNLEYTVQKCTEVGIDSFYFIHSDYENYQVENTDRYHKTALSACIQSKNPFIPKFERFSVKLADFFFNPQTLYFWGDPDQINLINTVASSELKNFIEICFINGPEGGWSPKEADFLKNRFRSIRLSDNVLRAETSAITAIFYFKLLLENNR